MSVCLCVWQVLFQLIMHLPISVTLRRKQTPLLPRLGESVAVFIDLQIQKLRDSQILHFDFFTSSFYFFFSSTSTDVASRIHCSGEYCPGANGTQVWWCHCLHATWVMWWVWVQVWALAFCLKLIPGSLALFICPLLILINFFHECSHDRFSAADLPLHTGLLLDSSPTCALCLLVQPTVFLLQSLIVK